MQFGPGLALPDFALAGKKVFVTSETGNGNIGSWISGTGYSGREAADKICQTLASDAGLDNASIFRAWISTSISNAASHIRSDGPWVRMDGVKFVDSKAELLSGKTYTSVSLNENGVHVTSSALAWTGTNGVGETTATTCGDWTDGTSGSDGTYGTTGFAGNRPDVSYWTKMTTVQCGYSSRLYCFEDQACTLSGTITDSSNSYTTGTPYTINLYYDAGKSNLAAQHSGTFQQDYSTGYSMDIGHLPPEEYYLEVTVSGGGLVSPSSATIDCGSTVDLPVSD